MRRLLALSCSLLIAGLLAGCASTAGKDLPLEKLDSDIASLAANENVQRYALVDLRQAEAVLRQLKNSKNLSAVDREHLVYVAERRMAIANARASKGAADAELLNLQRENDKILLLASLAEAEKARQEAEGLRRMNVARTEEAERARADAELATQQSVERQREAEEAREEAARAQRQADQRARDAELARQEAELAGAEADALRRQLENLQARRTDRGLVLTLGDVLFESAQAALRPESLANLDKLISVVEQYPDRTVNIEGHTDSRGSEQFNLNLSQQRAEAVQAALAERGVDHGRLKAVGLGEEFPVATNETEFGRQKNRRVEVIILDPAAG